MSKEYFCATEDDVEIITRNGEIMDIEFRDYSEIHACDHSEAAEDFSKKLDGHYGVVEDGRIIYVKCTKSQEIKKFNVNVYFDPTYSASEIEIGETD